MGSQRVGHDWATFTSLHSSGKSSTVVYQRHTRTEKDSDGKKYGEKWNQNQDLAGHRNLEELRWRLRRKYDSWHFLSRFIWGLPEFRGANLLKTEAQLRTRSWFQEGLPAPPTLLWLRDLCLPPSPHSSGEEGSCHLPGVLNVHPVPCLCLQSSFYLK